MTSIKNLFPFVLDLVNITKHNAGPDKRVHIVHWMKFPAFVHKYSRCHKRGKGEEKNGMDEVIPVVEFLQCKQFNYLKESIQIYVVETMCFFMDI